MAPKITLPQRAGSTPPSAFSLPQIASAFSSFSSLTSVSWIVVPYRYLNNICRCHFYKEVCFPLPRFIQLDSWQNLIVIVIPCWDGSNLKFIFLSSFLIKGTFTTTPSIPNSFWKLLENSWMYDLYFVTASSVVVVLFLHRYQARLLKVKATAQCFHIAHHMLCAMNA